MEDNDRAIREDIDLLEGQRMMVSFTSAIVNQAMATIYNHYVRSIEFKAGNLVLQRAII